MPLIPLRASLLLLAAMLLAAAALVLGCGSPSSAPPSGPADSSPIPIGLPRSSIAFTGTGGRTANLTVEMPCTAQQRQQGLMFREIMPDDQGMLFFPLSGSGFWMKDTLIPLTAAFISAEGVIVHLEDMQPQTTVAHTSPRPYYYGLEVNQGWFARNGIGVGDRVSLPWPLDPPPAEPPPCS